MSLLRGFINRDLGFGMCCWEAPSVEDLKELFDKAGTPYESMIPVEEYDASAA